MIAAVGHGLALSTSFAAVGHGFALVELIRRFPFSACIIVGPEGDFSEFERAEILAYRSVQSIKINENILRSETAVISAISIINYVTN